MVAGGRAIGKQLVVALACGMAFVLGMAAAQTSLTYIDILNNQLVANKIVLAGQLVGGKLNAGSVSTTPFAPNAFPGDFTMGVSTAPPFGPGFGALTLRARRSVTVPGACSLWAIGGNASQETLLKDGIPGNC